MSRKIPPLPALLAFEAVARHGSFALASQELSITRSAVSHRIKALEAFFGAQLLVRRRAAVALTPKGTLLLDAIGDALSMLGDSCERLATGDCEVVHLSVGLAFASAWLMARLPAFHRLHRNIELEVSALRMTPANKLACLQTGEVDIVISHGAPCDWSGFEYFEIAKCRVFPVCSPAYEASMGGLDSPQSLLKATLLRLPRHPWRPWFKAAGIVCHEPTRGPLFSHAGLMIDAAANGHGVALVRDVLVAEDIAEGRLKRLGEVAVDDAYYAVYRAQASSKPGVSACLEWLATLSEAARTHRLRKAVAES